MMRDRKINRLKGYDYASAGFYFVTVCINKNIFSNTGVGAGSHARPNMLDFHPNIFGDIVNGVMKLNDVGRMIERVWCEIPEHYEGVAIDPDYIVMPDHFHGIVVMGDGRGWDNGRAWEPARTRVRGMTLSDVMHRFKSLTTKLYRRDFLFNDRSPIQVGLWKRSFYDRIIRDGRDHAMIREYIEKNPVQWDKGDGDHKDCIHANDGGL